MNRKLTVLFFAAHSLAFAATPIAGTAVQKTATISFTQAGSGSFSITVKNRSNNQATGNNIVRWSNLTAKELGWRLSDQYVEIHNTANHAGFKISIYTDNLTEPKLYTGPVSVHTSTASFAVPNSDNRNNFFGDRALGLAWRIVDQAGNAAHLPSDASAFNTFVTSNATQFKNNLTCDETSPKNVNDCLNYFWFYTTDLKTGIPGKNLTAQDLDYRVVWTDRGIHLTTGMDGYFPAATPNYIYFALEETRLTVSANPYLTSRLILELTIP